MVNLEKLKQRFKRILSLDAHPGHISLGFAVGVFISFTPFFGLHTPLAIALAFIFRLNKLTCITGAWINTPFTVVPVLLLSDWLGRIILGWPSANLKIGLNDLSLDLVKKLGSQFYPLVLGSSLLGFAAALVSYCICYRMVMAFRKKDETQAELAREMEEVGEELE